MASYDMSLVDEVRKRIDATYEEALAGLDEAEGDLLRALAAVERRRAQKEAAAESGEMFGRAIGLAKDGKLKGIRLKLGERVLRELPLPKGLGGAVLAAVLSTFFSQVSVDLMRKDPGEELGDLEV